MAKYSVREATLNDLDFIVNAIIEAEKSGSEVLSYSTVFNLSETEIREIFRQMILEEIDGCEFSITNYLVAETNGIVVAAIGAWVEQEEVSSSIIKSNLLSFYLPPSSIIYASQNAKITSELVIDHTIGALSLVVVYISPEHRGQGLFDVLVNSHILRSPGVQELSIQVMANNLFAIRSYERNGFKKWLVKKTENEKIREFLPYNEKVLLKKSIYI